MFETLITAIGRWARELPDKEAVIFKKDVLTYRQLSSRIVCAGQLLAEMGVRPGSRVLFTTLAKPDMPVVYLGIQYAGGVAVFLDKGATADSMADIAEQTDAALVLTDKPMKGYEDRFRIESLRKFCADAAERAGKQGDSAVRLNAAAPSDPGKESGNDAANSASACPIGISYHAPSPEDAAEMLFTTGTTGRPKGVVLSYRAVYTITQNMIAGIGTEQSDRLLIPLPLNHSFGLRQLRTILYVGGTAVLQNGFTFARDLEVNISEHGCTAMCSVPASLELVRGQMQDRFSEIIGQLRYLDIGAGSLSVRQRKDFSALLPDTRIMNTWGSSETGGALFTDVHLVTEKCPEKIAAIGKPGEGIEVRITDAEGREMVRTDEEHPGKLSLKGGMVMSGYWKRDDLNAQVLKDGYLLTNDLVWQDEDHYYYMIGREDDIINVGGEKVSPVEVENAAGLYGPVKECACIGVPDEVMGQVPALFLAVDDGYSEAGMRKFLAGKIEKAKMPAQFYIIDALPRNRMKKVDRRAIRAMYDEMRKRSAKTEDGPQGVKETAEGPEGTGCPDAASGPEGTGHLGDVSHPDAASGPEEIRRPEDDPAVRAILTRRSVRHFQEKEVPKEILDVILRAGLQAPVGKNLQTWKFTVLTKKEQILHLKEACEKAAREQKSGVYGFYDPAVLILVSNDERNEDGCQSASCAAENMLLAAHALGLGGVWLNPLMKLRNASPVKELLDEWGVPARHIVWCAAAVGYPAEEPKEIRRRTDVLHIL